jgi:hypothetical protein
MGNEAVIKIGNRAEALAVLDEAIEEYKRHNACDAYYWLLMERLQALRAAIEGGIV